MKNFHAIYCTMSRSSSADSSETSPRRVAPVQKFYFGGLDGSDLVSRSTKTDGDTTIKYLILQNDELHKRNETLSTDVKRVTAGKREISDEANRLRRHKEVLKGYLGNYQELVNSYQTLEIQRATLIAILRNACRLLKVYFVLTVTISIPVSLLLYLNLSEGVTVLTSLTLSGVIVYDAYRRFRKNRCDQKFMEREIGTINDQIAQIRRANSLVEDLLANF